MIWIFIFIATAFCVYFGIELYLYFRVPKTPTDWHAMSEWAWRRHVRKSIDEMLGE